MNILSIPDICADLTDVSTVEKLPCNAFDIIIPIYANYHVYGESWQDLPNQVFNFYIFVFYFYHILLNGMPDLFVEYWTCM